MGVLPPLDLLQQADRVMDHLCQEITNHDPTASQPIADCCTPKWCRSTTVLSEAPTKRYGHNQLVDTHRCSGNAPGHCDLWMPEPMPPHLRSSATLNLSNNARWGRPLSLNSRQPQQARIMSENPQQLSSTYSSTSSFLILFDTSNGRCNRFSAPDPPTLLLHRRRSAADPQRQPAVHLGGEARGAP